jgi:hypothetical protein
MSSLPSFHYSHWLPMACLYHVVVYWPSEDQIYYTWLFNHT